MDSPRVLRLAAVCTGLLVAEDAAAQVQWTEIPTATRPAARTRAGIAYDETRDRIVMFGGQNAAVVTLGDTWLFDGTDWVGVTPTVAPPPRTAMMMAHDSVRRRVVLFGGLDLAGGAAFGDTWDWDGTGWTRRMPSNSPSPRSYAGMAFDSDRGRMVLFGGRLAFSSYSNDTWEWDGTDWTRATPTRHPSAGANFSMCYDPERRRTILTGGLFYNGQGLLFRAETWEWDGTEWTLLPPANNPLSTWDESAVYDAARRRIVYSQGLAGTVNEWVGSSWIQRSPAPQLPTDHYSMSLTYDSLRQRIVGFGGHPSSLGPGPVFDRTWSYTPVWPARVTSFGAGCAGSAGTPRLAGAPPWLAEIAPLELSSLPAGAPAWFLVGASDTTSSFGPLPLPLAAIGMPGCSLFVSTELFGFVTSSGGVATLPLPIPADPGLLGARFYGQGAVLDQGSNALGIVVSDAVAATIGSK